MARTLRTLFAAGLIVLAIACLPGARQPVLAGGALVEENPPAGQTSTAPVTPQVVLDKMLYLPAIQKPPVYLVGKMTFKGAPVAGQLLELRYFDGFSYSTYATATTDAGGNYKFSALPALTAGQSMYVRWINTSFNANWLYSWVCNELTAYPSSDVTCSFDIQDIKMNAPPPGALISLPYTFSWTKRVTTSDNYFIEIFDPYDMDPWIYTDPPLGYVSSYRINNIPPFMQTYYTYGWSMGVYGANGQGSSYYYFEVAFTNLGTLAASPQEALAMQPFQRKLDRPAPNRQP